MARADLVLAQDINVQQSLQQKQRASMLSQAVVTVASAAL
jgi:hypothetical protein